MDETERGVSSTLRESPKTLEMGRTVGMIAAAVSVDMYQAGHIRRTVWISGAPGAADGFSFGTSDEVRVGDRFNQF